VKEQSDFILNERLEKYRDKIQIIFKNMVNLCSEDPKTRPSCNEIKNQINNWQLTFNDVERDPSVELVISNIWRKDEKEMSFLDRILIEIIKYEIRTSFLYEREIYNIDEDYIKICKLITNKSLIVETDEKITYEVERYLPKFIHALNISTCFNDFKNLIESNFGMA